MKQTWPLLCAILLIFLNPLPARAVSGPLHASGNQVIDSTGKPVRIAGVNWFGAETATFVPHGLWTRNYRGMMDQMKALGFNAIRLPFSNQLFDSSSVPNSINFAANPDLQGLSGLQIIDKIVAYADQIGLYVILDRHRSDAGAGPNDSGLWYTSAYPESRWISDWRMLAQHYARNRSVIGADLCNEPHGGATWGSGDTATDWRLAAERGGNAILAVNPNWLIIVEGIESYDRFSYWWGGNLAGAGSFPVRLNVAGRLVYSAHDYPNSVYPQTWFSDPSFPSNLPAVWNQAWGYLFRNGVAPIVLSEFGSKFIDPKDAPWMDTLTAYLNGDFTLSGRSSWSAGQAGISWAWWSWNPNSGDTGGILQDDWNSVQQLKLDKLKPLMPSTTSATPSPSPSRRPAATPTRRPTPTRTPTVRPTAKLTPRPTRTPTRRPSSTPTARPTLSTTRSATPSPTPTRRPSRTATRVPTPKPTAASRALKVRYRTPATATTTNSAAPWFEIVNGGAAAVPLSQLSLRYGLPAITPQPRRPSTAIGRSPDAASRAASSDCQARARGPTAT